MKYEYLTFYKSLSVDKLNELGLEGWELISHTAVANNYEQAQCYIFKRTIDYE